MHTCAYAPVDIQCTDCEKGFITDSEAEENLKPSSTKLNQLGQTANLSVSSFATNTIDDEPAVGSQDVLSRT